MTIASIILFILFVIFFICFFTADPEISYESGTGKCKKDRSFNDLSFKLSCRFVGAAIILGVLVCLIPSKQDAMLIYILPKIVNNPQMQNLSPKLLQAINDTLDSYDQYIKHKLDDHIKK